MGAGIATVGKRPYAVGLYWENSPSGGRVSQIAKEAARQPGQQADFYAVRGGNKEGRVPQFGLGQISAGHKAGMPSIAGCLANQQGGSWVGAFRLREGTVITVVRDDLILPDGDQLYANEAEARDRLLQEIGFGGLGRTFAPESWAIPGADTMPLSLLLDERHDIRLQAVTIPKKALLIGAAILGALILIAGGFWVYQNQKEAEEQSRREQQAALERLKQNLVPKILQPDTPQYPPPERKWESRPYAMPVVAACQDGLKKITAGFAGWHLGTLKCDGTSITTTWTSTKGFSTPPQLEPPIKTSLNETGTSATIIIPLAPLEPRGAETLLDPEVITRLHSAQNWPGTLAVMQDDPPPPPSAQLSGAMGTTTGTMD